MAMITSLQPKLATQLGALQLCAPFQHPSHHNRRVAVQQRRICVCSLDQDEIIAGIAEPERSALSPNACCFGCGVRLQTANVQAAGYIEPEKYALKKRHKQLNQLICGRCQELSNGAMLPAVADFAQRVQPATNMAGKSLLTPEELREQLTVVRERHAVVVLLVDLLDASGSILSGIRDLVGRNPIVLVGTKADLLPPGTNPADVAEWLFDLAAFKRINVVDVHVLSSKSGEGVDRAVAEIKKERKGRDVYVLGAANVGKSAFIRALVRDMSKMTSRQYDPMAAARTKTLPVESPMPGTTLGTIPLNVFSAGGLLYDTPGLHLHHRMPHLLTPDENKTLHPRKKLRPYVAPPPATVPTNEQKESSGIASYSWGGLARIDVLQGPGDLHLVFYGPPALKVIAKRIASTESSPDSNTITEAEAFGAGSVAARGGLKAIKTLNIGKKGVRGEGSIADVAVSGVPGWVTLYSQEMRQNEEVVLRVSTPVGVEVFARPPIPVGNPFE